MRTTPTVLAVREGDTERVVNSYTGRIVILDHAKRSATDYSLYSQPAFREMELVNRAAMSGGIAKALGQEYDQVEAEAELGMRGNPPAKLNMSEAQREDERVFVLNGREMASFAPAALHVPPTLESAFDRLLLLEAQLHPRVREALAAGKQLPARLNFGFRMFQAETSVTWELREATLEDMDLGEVASVYPAAPVTGMPIMVTAWRVVTGQAGSPPTSSDYAERAARLLAEGRAFEGFLVGMEATLATGDMPTAAMKRAREAGAAIYVQRANQYVRMRQGEQALQEFERALAANPFIVGVWHDAGWMLVQDYATSLGWTCWDAARSAAPNAPALKDVTKLEVDLRLKHPEFF